MKRFGLMWLVIAVGLALPTLTGTAAEMTNEPAKDKKEVVSKAAEVTQAELAQLLVQVLGLSRFLPPSPSNQECIRMLMDNEIVPEGGWQPEKAVTRADLARVIVCMMKKQRDVKNPDDAKEWINYLKTQGVPLDAVGETVSYSGPLAEPVAPHVVSAQVDPLVKRHKFNPLDETQYGVDMAYVVRVLSQFEFTSGAFKPKPVTQD